MTYLQPEDLTGKSFERPPPASIQVNAAQQGDIEDLAQQLVDGNVLPATLSKRSASYNATLAKANKLSREQTGKPINLNKMQLDFEAAKKFIGTMNGSQVVRYRGLAESVVNTIDEVKRLAEELKQGGVQKWNQARRGTIQQVYGNTPQSTQAAQYVGAVNTLKEEFANLAQGGFAPTEAAWQLANQQINTDFGFKDMAASLTEVQRLINYRTHAIVDQQPVTVGGPSTMLSSTSPAPNAAAGPKDGDTEPITDPGYPPGAMRQFKGGQWVRIK